MPKRYPEYTLSGMEAIPENPPETCAENPLEGGAEEGPENFPEPVSDLPLASRGPDSGVPKPKAQRQRRPLRPIKNEQKRRRLSYVRALVELGMAVEQMHGYLPTVGEPVALSTLYEYLGKMRLPRSYKVSEGKQSEHDY